MMRRNECDLLSRAVCASRVPGKETVEEEGARNMAGNMLENGMGIAIGPKDGMDCLETLKKGWKKTHEMQRYS